ncbi:6-phosphogluconolactonase [Chenggangzhangella methanolivorans]|uniref:6-phosphogluconolactonase n=1 Tax=Chenggangzhangella methanolivorans TaxID=1437009 RepID=A0A9E6UMW6_9HYPH|nr:6-phosphogluconolactonase [Chenggangzhangella methanolivorans]QZN99583.1 6-phosphogluconolactonase [Chenggangzhangella methanolivorans]
MSALAVNLRTFPDRETLAQALADEVAEALRGAIADGGGATLAVSGGSTPKLFFHALSKAELDWESVTVTLVDERWVPDTEERSNARLVQEHLLLNEAARAVFAPLYNGASAPEGALPEVQEAISGLSGPLTVAILGMGDDGHTASFFPSGDRLEDAIDPTGKALVMSMRATAAIEPRITLTLPVLLAAKKLVLHVEGEKKKDVLDEALSSDDAAKMPIRAVIANAREPLETVWAP